MATKPIMNGTAIALPENMVKNALKMAATSAKRMAVAQTAKYGPDHILVQTLHDEADAYETAATHPISS